MNKNLNYLFFIGLLAMSFSCQTNKEGALSLLMKKGEYEQVKRVIDQKMKDESLSDLAKRSFLYQLDQIKRIKREFSLHQSDVERRLSKYFGDSTSIYMLKWEKDKSLEYRMIDGEKHYFKNSVSNLFRMNHFAKNRREQMDGKYEDQLAIYCLNHTNKLVQHSKGVGELIHPVNNTFDYTIRVKADVVPAGEVIRCWMPYPRENHMRQQSVELISILADRYIIAPDSMLQRSIYSEKKAVAGKETVFQVKFKTTSYAQVFYPENMQIKAYDKNSELYQKYTKQEAPQIVFSDRIKKLADQICGNVSDPLQQVNLLYNWIDNSIPWASALEYCTMPNIPEYVLENMHGDCGMQTLLFLTMARHRGIPCKWQSGWMIHPGHVNLHDWCEVYYEGVGWVPLDQSFEMQKSEVPHVKNFYKTGIDAYRLIVNDDFSQEFYPKKNWPRSEPIDFQRGELEWAGGNLYFSDWTYKMKVDNE